MTLPLVSCLMITQPGRLTMFKEAVEDFLRQSYQPKELVVVTSAPAEEMREYSEFVATTKGPISFYQLDSPVSLGAMRNVSNDQAHGELCCTWDDDDRYHPDRLQAHYDTIKAAGGGISYFAEQLHYFPLLRQMYWIQWATRCPGIVMYHRDTRVRYPETGPKSERGEDAAFITALVGSGQQQTPVTDCGHMYLRRFHGHNTWGFAHHMGVARRYALSSGELEKRKKRLRAALAYYKLPRPLTVHSRQGRVLTY